MIVVAGEALVDRIVQPDGAAVELPGGGPYNTARAIARLGVPVAFLGCLSTDRSGGALRQALAADGVDLSLATTTQAPTTLAEAAIDAHGNAKYRFETIGTSAPLLDAEACLAALATRPAALHVGTLGLVLEPMATAIAEAVAQVPAATLVMVDPNCRPPAIGDRATYVARLQRVIRRADVVKASRVDIAYLWPGATIGRAARAILDAGPKVFIVTDGPRPVACHTIDRTFELDVPQVTVADSVGAGDAFGGAFLARSIEIGLDREMLADETTLREAVRLAIEVAVATCRRPGADPPRRYELSWPAG